MGTFKNSVAVYRVCAVLSMAALGLLAGCAKDFGASAAGPPDTIEEKGIPVNPAPPEPGLPLAIEQRFKDIPLPSGLREDAERTFVYESQSLQIGRMVYTSRASVNELAQFYIKEAPVADWDLVSAEQSAGGTRLVFTKPGKRLEVSVRPTGITRSQELVLHLTPDEATAGRAG